ncbi:pickpocket protein 28-like [Arctopsyche grandis]|uniref:pickpocket protein 28-like n=1 Tax=Arctopsyche grandis TaxID=121162 RepID=UPI00406D9337
MALKFNSTNRRHLGVTKRSPKKTKKSFLQIARTLAVTMAFGYQKRTENNLRTRKQTPTSDMKSWGNTDYFKAVKSYDKEYNESNPKTLFGTVKKGGIEKKLKKQESYSKLSEGDLLNKDISCFSLKGFQINLKQYLMKCTLHGFRYIGDGHLSPLERAFWLISVLIAIVTAAYFIGNIYQRWDNQPLIVSLNPEPAQLTSIPFPAITICNMNQARKTIADRIMSEKSSSDKKLLQMLCNIENDTAVVDIDSTVQAGEWTYFKHFLINICLIQVTQPCTQLIPGCRWKSATRNCETLFNAALTDEGLCCTFNSLHREMMFRNPRDLSDLNITFPFPAVDWTFEEGYPDDAPADGFPWRPNGVGANLGLTLILDAAIDEYYCSSTSSVGFKILLHNPSETPKIKDFGDLIPPGRESRVVVKPRIYDAQPNVRSISLNKRRCYFSDERQLVYYRTYTQKNCEMECEARLTIERCNCSQYFMPKNSSIRICGVADASCYVELKVNESSLMVDTNCDECFPSCYELSYGKEYSTAPLTDNFLIHEENLLGKSPEYFKNNMAIVHIYFVEASFIRFTKGELFGFTDFLSNTGGLLGLFLGFSFLSLVEIVYYVTLRLLCAYYRHDYPTSNNAVYPFSQ